ncbi:MAG: hypothetical protein JNG89_07730 [Planctomycetaceae bacterium]|nr:hypothetical protein [Planctomycetaceae bacterium]
MFRIACVLFGVSLLAPIASAQEYYPESYGGGGDFYGPASVGSSEPLFSYDDQEPWKHGYLQIMPYYGGHHLFRPYNYKAVFSQSQVAAGWGMPNVMPYSQQFWHRYEQQADLSQPRPLPQLAPQPGYFPPSAAPQPGYFPPSSTPQGWYVPTSQNAPQATALPAGYAAPLTGQPLSQPRGGESLRGPSLP